MDIERAQKFLWYIHWMIFLGAYLISQIPLPEFGLGRSDPQLGFELQRDLSEYSDEYYEGIDVKYNN